MKPPERPDSYWCLDYRSSSIHPFEFGASSSVKRRVRSEDWVGEGSFVARRETEDHPKGIEKGTIGLKSERKLYACLSVSACVAPVDVESVDSRTPKKGPERNTASHSRAWHTWWNHSDSRHTTIYSPARVSEI